MSNNMRKLFSMIADSKDKKEKLIESLQENELLNTDEKKKIIDQIKTMHDFFKQMHTNKGALDKVLRNYMKDYRAVIKSIGVDKFKKVYQLLESETMELLHAIAKNPNFLFSKFDRSILGIFLPFFSKPIMFKMSIREMDSQIELYGTKLPLLKLFVMTDEEVNFYANLKTIEQYNDYVRDLLMKFDLEKYMKEKGVQNA
ncbi:cag pathogenicity island protein CagS [Helicobacter pylori]|uniref:cag pathogenicity island protein CagS n=1 Tax=Helicobacter pylori TaxID=210 RepID=UPI0001853CB9|nr:cag pathogenicity island protein CagS [Helicobacter pylori]AHN34826.1 cag pathogenicity island protein [Helicobacter pylori oki102]AHN36305.1 cag pathogenicity island protein [Helicobacter pylori oki112]AHN40607.1 cag pathogenicity island protein [Helicobacter pylori oki422]AHN44972.1 cag pathogenicity island protein [Helicobacter pylori oki898]KMZ49100.1 cag pathogenicity island protein [Helicobacter pylori]